MKTHILCSINFFRKSHRLSDNVDKCSGNRGATNDVTWRIRVACWISKATCTYAHAHAHAPVYPHTRTHAQACTHRPICNTFAFHSNNGFVNTPQCYVIRTLSVLLKLNSNMLAPLVIWTPVIDLSTTLCTSTSNAKPNTDDDEIKQKIHSYESNSSSASQEIPCILFNPKVNDRGHNTLPLDPIRSHFNQIHTLAPN